MAETLAKRRPSSGLQQDLRRESLQRLIEHAAHFLPSQGPISVFVHHNTLHALEHLRFADALRQGLEIYECEPYLSEKRYREELARGRITAADLTTVLQEELGDRADELIGLLGTRFHLRLAMLKHGLHTASTAELHWVVAETDALRRFRSDVPEEMRRRSIDGTRHWIMRDFRDGQPAAAIDKSTHPARAIVGELLEAFGAGNIEEWSNEVWEQFYLQLLWRLCEQGVSQSQAPCPLAARASGRHRDVLLATTGIDSDELVHELLIRYTAAFLDQGFTHWPLPSREQGFYGSFLRLYGERNRVVPRWMQGCPEKLQQLADGSVTPLQCIEESLDALGVAEAQREAFITSSLLTLRGWAGMIWQMETNAEWAVRPAPRGTLIEFLAVRLLLDQFAVAHVARGELNHRGPLRDIAATSGTHGTHGTQSRGSCEAQRAFLFFQLAQILGLRPEELQDLPVKTWTRWSLEIEDFPEVERRRIFHLAYERRFRDQTLDAIAIHTRAVAKNRQASPPTPDFQLFCCIDDREESFRRHLEEIHPGCETFGYAGFFGVAMYYRGTTDAKARPLCPVVIKPKHYVEELPVFTLEEAHRRRTKVRRWVGAASHYIHRGSRSLAGGAVTAVFGSLASAPLVARILFPRTASRLRGLFGKLVAPAERTQLLLERREPTPGPEDGHVGYTPDEMADIVARTLQDNGLTKRFAPLVILCGHGSSSLNNPHESAYNCGACSGGRGGPNARAFAQMANDPRVRSKLANRGLEIPAETYFIGGFHNTCNDRVTYFDLERVPLTHKDVFATARRAVDEARERNAHERCRRFESVSLAMTPKAALVHVEQRAEDLSQARPEYNHATNAVTFVGRRSQVRGLFMDRRTFLASYDPTQDDEARTILARILSAVVPVCAGISLEYYFSCVDPQGYGCGSKLPHNIVSMLGVMEGALGDLRPGLSAQMTEIHEPVRNLFVIETTPDAMTRIMDGNPVISQLCRNDWVQLATLDPKDNSLHVYREGVFEPYWSHTDKLPTVNSSVDWYRGWRDHLGYAQIGGAAHQGMTATTQGATR